MNKSVIIGLFLMASLLVGTSVNVNMFSPAMASEKDRDDDKRHQYDKDNNKYEQSTYESDPYTNSYGMSYNDDSRYDNSYDNGYDRASYDQQRYDATYDKTAYNVEDTYSKYPTKDKKYECRTGLFEGFFVSSVEFCKLKIGEGKQGPPGSQGIQRPPGADWFDGGNWTNGLPGPPRITQLINSINIYPVQNIGAPGEIVNAECEPGDFALSGGFTFKGSPGEAVP